jgi:NAD(P)-dependent dehydrogenase (short-subunit alcohol dehydrogenase family)
VTRVALVTGANRGIGKETARQLASLGMRVLIGSREPGPGADAAAELASAGGDVAAVPLDVTDEASVLAARAAIERTHGCLDVLVNNAGVFVGATALDTSVDTMRRTFDVNVFGVVTTIGRLLPLLRRSTAPRIVNVSSTTGSLQGTVNGMDMPGDATRRLAYATSKAALNMLTVQYAKAFAADPGLRRIKVNSATPGYTATRMNDFRGTRTVRAAAGVVVRLATLPDDGPSGGFFGDEGPVAW